VTDTSVWQSSRVVATGSSGHVAHGGRRRWAVGLWALLHAQALLQGTVGALGDPGLVEDDRYRLATRCESNRRA